MYSDIFVSFSYISTTLIIIININYLIIIVNIPVPLRVRARLLLPAVLHHVLRLRKRHGSGEGLRCLRPAKAIQGSDEGACIPGIRCINKAFRHAVRWLFIFVSNICDWLE